jgi:phosphoribosylanthranilate isomerase
VTRVKICGITRLEDARLAADLGASAVGFVFWPGSPRFIDPFRARRIASSLPPMVATVGIFVDQPIEHVRGIARLVGLTAVQLHGSESNDYAAAVGARIIKAVGVGPSFDADAAVSMPAAMTLLLDAHDPALKGGTGRVIDWARAERVARVRPVILSGGLRPDSVADAIAAVRPYAIDVSSGVEERPGIKDPARLRALFGALAGNGAVR